ncbi:hypothetical protein MKK69_17395 [Methylobacterium sp. J-026]|uniref:hypothetical protein n=1 Tax=Methylobacterium sp. J-026 TaxID=2836624 RepID=UPI001FBB027D|nr:hypothetical protein [Methylobacterium sp. J-026]MCJ2135807.1 hypothetical protein [Methylobacterium sp. J-026]
MSHRTKTFAAASLAAAGLMALLGTPGASAQERITLETIGAVRMARVEEVRGADPERQPANAASARDQAAGRTTRAR